jgi:acetyltransferase-like isoleucine patch superfamily enzyme
MKPPKLLEPIFLFYPAIQTVLIAVTAVCFIRTLDPASFALWFFFSYLMSPVIWGLLRMVFRQNAEGNYHIGKRAKHGNLWFLYYQLQSVYSHFAFFERSLKVFPGAYSLWLRMWGSKIGRAVNWTPECQIVDRGHLEIGDRSFIGNRSYMSAHILKKSKDRYFLYVKRIQIGSDTMVSYHAHLSPGVVVGSRVHLEPGAELYPNMRIEDGETFKHERMART